MISAAPVTAQLIGDAAAPHTVVVDAVAGRRLDAPTPCAQWDVRALVRHLLYWTPVLAATGRREVPAPPAPDESAVEVDDGWPDALAASRAQLVAVWSDPSAWTGTVSMGGPDELPASMIGGMVLGELVLHGWDLARSAGLHPRWPDGVLDGALAAVGAMAEQGRGMGVFADAVPVPPDAPTLDRVVALSGRDPGWTA
ncbi:TIGR03086 family metal-binding protein [Pseudonocardia sp. KRD291]|uniref:TIGR03086 family metal-binding protein n=1 Tax=Pseudonocardia sp. KRD291 TaxID=2792007 RepID=UPI001C4A12C6|nr:TIGR03086 family metal-binding protein [Pseudonocardia sp. KRD291]MBW0104731.1 TIGR03086 family protein [Pseudonocardia sp. KRD291]